MAPALINFEMWAGDDQYLVVPDLVQDDGVTPYDFTGKTIQYVAQESMIATPRVILTNTTGIDSSTPGTLIFSFTAAQASAMIGIINHQAAITDPGLHEMILYGSAYTHETARTS